MTLDLSKEEIALVVSSMLLHLETADAVAKDASLASVDVAEYENWRQVMRRIQHKLLSANNPVPAKPTAEQEQSKGAAQAERMRGNPLSP